MTTPFAITKEMADAPSIPLVPSINPMTMLDRAVANGSSIEVLTKLMDLQERWEKNSARKLFDEAVAAAKAELPPVVRNREGHNSKRYADFAAIAKAVDPVITKHGLSYRFRTEQNERISVTCILSHRAGHSETTTLSGPADSSGNKNPIQSIGSTLAYLQRYSLVQMLGVAIGDDDDGKTAGDGEPISESQVEKLQSLIVEVAADIPKFVKYMKVGRLEEIPSGQFKRAVEALESKRAK